MGNNKKLFGYIDFILPFLIVFRFITY